MDIWNTLTTFGAQFIQWLPENSDKWLGYIIHPEGWAWFLCAFVAAVWMCSRFVVRPLSKVIAKQSENEIHTLKYLRIAVDELRSELKSLENKGSGGAEARLALDELRSILNSVKRSAAKEPPEKVEAEANAKVTPRSATRQPISALR